MINLQNPDLRLNLSTGIPGIAFHLSRTHDLAVLADDNFFSGPPPYGPLGFWILKNRRRDFVSEKHLLEQQKTFGKIKVQKLGRGTLMTIAEEDLQELYRVAKGLFGKRKVA